MRVQQLDSLLNEERGLIHKLDVLMLEFVSLGLSIFWHLCRHRLVCNLIVWHVVAILISLVFNETDSVMLFEKYLLTLDYPTDR